MNETMMNCRFELFGVLFRSSLNLCGISTYTMQLVVKLFDICQGSAPILLATGNWLRLMFRRWIPGKWTTRVRKFYNAVFENEEFGILDISFFFFKKLF